MSKAKPRKRHQLRPTTIEPHRTAAAGSVIIRQGDTHVLCTASIASEVPRWLLDPQTGEPKRGWVTAEYNMMPGSTPDRKRRGPDSRGTEIQRLIGRVLRAAVDLDKMPGVAITCDCDVMLADGGTRTASITGAFVALSQAIAAARKAGLIKGNPIKGPVAAVSVGVVDGQIYTDLDYPLDVRAEVDMNVAMNHQGQFIEVQGTGEQGVFSREQLDELLDAATKGIRQLMKVQRKALS
ncbi:ribonuclease PH [Phycisphaerales bacterium AB-hyl4]|uniref:Ribonuclease PH n=1 Tax=Natronomicrosphaera hydrolytica TaxID=3242702 RepID=A0ABV4U116_9BACT